MRDCVPFVCWYYIVYGWDISSRISTVYFLNRTLYVWAVAMQNVVSQSSKKNDITTMRAIKWQNGIF
jgi:hypothetical protein